MPKQKLTHHFLIASPQINDALFLGTLIYVVRHTDEISWGFIINRAIDDMTIGNLMDNLGLSCTPNHSQTAVMHGGPVRPEAGYILHTGQPDYRYSLVVDENICLTTSQDVLEAICEGSVSHFLLCLGFCHWHKGQLDKQIANGDWLICPADLQILFGTPLDQKYQKACDKIGINPQLLAPATGHA
ncbi:YqgE/AlgH family protein [Moraxella nasovis]|uniref:YqgE/AlgH family protein n=1 Tax=Moraxella nasovis TaxID=2904121 RepID=UPI001F6044C7|nr:YqgE/AlgH family protein [Moraxella nasovis]UNU72520.1 YqgE/AlgH family protein [Moraxella nasovis]